MDQITQFIIKNSHCAVWISFVLTLLAGFCIPISIDVIMVLSAFLAATTIPEQTVPLYLSLLIGCHLSAWIAYWVGRIMGPKLLKFPVFEKIVPENKQKKIHRFYQKHGLLTLLIGRFIPFGIRNCIFITTGLSKLNFVQFIRRDAFACIIWTTSCFFAYYSLGQNFNLLMKKIKTLNLFIFLTFFVAVITILCYKKYRKKRFKKLDKNLGLKP